MEKWEAFLCEQPRSELRARNHTHAKAIGGCGQIAGSNRLGYELASRVRISDRKSAAEPAKAACNFDAFLPKRNRTITRHCKAADNLCPMHESPEHTPDSAAPSAEWRSYVLGTNVNRLRTRSKINKKTFALMAGISRPLLDRIEKGEANPRISIVEQLAAALETTPQELLTPPFEPFPLPTRLKNKQPGRSGCPSSGTKAQPPKEGSASKKNPKGD